MDKIMTPRITPHQHAYLKAIADGHTTTPQLMAHLDTGQNNVSRILRVLRDAGLVSFAPLPGTQSAKQFHLTAPLEDLDFEIAYRPTHKTYTPPSEEELRYIAKISDEDKLIGQRRIAAHQKKYPERTARSMKTLVAKARNLGYCR